MDYQSIGLENAQRWKRTANVSNSLQSISNETKQKGSPANEFSGEIEELLGMIPGPPNTLISSDELPPLSEIGMT